MDITETLLDDLDHNDNNHRILERGTERRLTHRVPGLVGQGWQLKQQKLLPHSGGGQKSRSGCCRAAVCGGLSPWLPDDLLPVSLGGP